MQKLRKTYVSFLLVLLIVVAEAVGAASADESLEGVDEVADEVVDEVVDSGEGVLPQEQQGPAPAGRKRKLAKGGRTRDRNSEKETDGTQARDRFEATTAVKSKYESGGQPLEVDTD